MDSFIEDTQGSATMLVRPRGMVGNLVNTKPSDVIPYQAIRWPGNGSQRRTITVDHTYSDNNTFIYILSGASPLGRFKVTRRGKCRRDAAKAGSRKMSKLVTVYEVLHCNELIWFHESMVSFSEPDASSASSSSSAASSASQAVAAAPIVPSSAASSTQGSPAVQPLQPVSTPIAISLSSTRPFFSSPSAGSSPIMPLNYGLFAVPQPAQPSMIKLVSLPPTPSLGGMPRTPLGASGSLSLATMLSSNQQQLQQQLQQQQQQLQLQQQQLQPLQQQQQTPQQRELESPPATKKIALQQALNSSAPINIPYFAPQLSLATISSSAPSSTSVPLVHYASPSALDAAARVGAIVTHCIEESYRSRSPCTRSPLLVLHLHEIFPNGSHIRVLQQLPEFCTLTPTGFVSFMKENLFKIYAPDAAETCLAAVKFGVELERLTSLWMTNTDPDLKLAGIISSLSEIVSAIQSILSPQLFERISSFLSRWPQLWAAHTTHDISFISKMFENEPIIGDGNTSFISSSPLTPMPFTFIKPF